MSLKITNAEAHFLKTFYGVLDFAAGINYEKICLSIKLNIFPDKSCFNLVWGLAIPSCHHHYPSTIFYEVFRSSSETPKTIGLPKISITLFAISHCQISDIFTVLSTTIFLRLFATLTKWEKSVSKKVHYCFLSCWFGLVGSFSRLRTKKSIMVHAL